LVHRPLTLPQASHQVLGPDLNRSEWWLSFISKGFYSPGFRPMSAFYKIAGAPSGIDSAVEVT
jgi:hypothetical protein